MSISFPLFYSFDSVQTAGRKHRIMTAGMLTIVVKSVGKVTGMNILVRAWST